MRPILIITLVLVTVGVIMIYSASAIFAEDKFGDQYYFFKRQILSAGIGLVALAAASFLPLRILPKLSKMLIVLTAAILVLVLLFGSRVGGAKRWLKFGGWSFQPAEMAKLVLIIYSAHFLSRKRELFHDFRCGILPLLLVVGIILFLILRQPDLGTAVLLGTVIFVMMFVAGVRMKHLMFLMLAAVPVVSLLIFKVGYRWRRILVFLNPWEDARNAGWQITQSFIALGSGGFAGRGWGKSVQKLYYLPESFTDFIFSIIGEEIGFIGACMILLLFAAFVCHGVKISRLSGDSFAHFLGMGITVMIGLQAMIHMGVVTGCLPTKGLPLPFVSFGGSSLVFSMMGAGFLINIARNYKEPIH